MATGGVVGSGGHSGIGGDSITGGTNNSGGVVGTGGSSVSGNAGGTAASGAGTGGTINAGGTGIGGSIGTGGKMVTGGTTSGANSGIGGLATGGANATGGAATGGVGIAGSGTGGSATGGAGGTSSKGGTTSMGGSSNAAGGTIATGGSSTAAGGTTTCAGRVISLSSNGTGTASDTAYAHVEADLKTDLPIGNAKRTLEFWAFIKTTDWVGERNELFYYGPATGATTAQTFGLDFGTNPVTGSTTNHATLNPFTNGGYTLDSTDNLGINSSTDQWVHIAMTWDGTVLLTYVNGLPKITINSTGGVTALATVQSVLSIGCNPTNKNCFNGEFDEFRVWNIARTGADIQANYNKPAAGNETGLVAYWKFDETTGTTTADAVTAAGHTAHPGTLMADTAAHNPTFVTPTSPVPLICP